MTKYLILIAILIAQKKTLPQTDDIIERKGKNKELFTEVSDFDLSDNESTNSND